MTELVPLRPSPMSSVAQLEPVWLRIWQQNLNKSRVAQEDLINSDVHKSYDLLILQEPYIDSYGNTKATRHWRVVYPSSCRTMALLPRAVVLVSTELDTNRWSQLDIPDRRDVVALRVTGEFGQVTIYDIYNDCSSSETITLLGAHFASLQWRAQPAGPAFSVWCGDFNRHHPMWDEERNHHLFTTVALREADKLIRMAADNNMEMVLPKGIPTLEAMATKNWT